MAGGHRDGVALVAVVQEEADRAAVARAEVAERRPHLSQRRKPIRGFEHGGGPALYAEVGTDLPFKARGSASVSREPSFAIQWLNRQGENS